MSKLEVYKYSCICGSTRFYDEMLKLASQLTEDGHIVHFPFAKKSNIETRNEPNMAYLETMLDDMHKRKIDFSARVYVYVGPNTYIGNSTREEVRYAKAHGKDVIYVKSI